MEDSGGSKKITFGKGGNQGARGSNSGGDFFVENIFEEPERSRAITNPSLKLNEAEPKPNRV